MIHILFYIVFLVITLGLTFALNTIFGVDTWQMCLLFVFTSFVFELALDAIIATVTRKLLPYRAIEKVVPKSGKRERKFYEFLGIKKWKNSIPDLGQFTNFQKSKLENPSDSKYLERFILESKYGEVIHVASMFASFLLLLLGIAKPNMLLTVFLPCSFINLYLNLLPALVQRYVRPRLEILYKRSLRE